MTWEERINRANKNKCFTKEDIEIASLWSTCPISEHADKIVLRDGDISKGPIDIYLLLDGLYFTKGVEEGDIGLATNCYNSIVNQVESLVNRTDRITMLKRYIGE